MNTKIEKLINDIAGDCRKVVKQWVIENWSRAIGDPVETYVTYGTKYRDEIKRLCNEGYKDELYKVMEEAVKGLKEIVFSVTCLCLRCGYEWDSKKPNPKQCPYCHSMKWNVPKQE